MLFGRSSFSLFVFFIKYPLYLAYFFQYFITFNMAKAIEIQLPTQWEMPLTTCPAWDPYFDLFSLPITPVMGSSMLLTKQYKFTFSKTPEVIMFAEDHTNPRIIKIIQKSLLTLVFGNYVHFADELLPAIELLELTEPSYLSMSMDLIDFYKHIKALNVSYYAVDDSYHHTFFHYLHIGQKLLPHTFQNTIEQRDQIMALRYLYILATGNGKLFSLNGYLHLGIARHLLAYGCKVIFISENTQITNNDPYMNYLKVSRQELLNKLLDSYSQFIYAELPLELGTTEHEKKINSEINQLIATKVFQPNQRWATNSGFFQGSISNKKTVNETEPLDKKYDLSP